jgi:hypothetical protein
MGSLAIFSAILYGLFFPETETKLLDDTLEEMIHAEDSDYFSEYETE